MADSFSAPGSLRRAVPMPRRPQLAKPASAPRPVAPVPVRQPALLIFLGAVFVVSTYLGAIRISDFPLAENPENVAGVLLAAVFALTRFGRARLWVGPGKYFLIYFGVTAGLALARYALERETASLRIYAQYAQAFLLYLIFFDLCRDRRAVRVLMVTFLGATMLLSLVANLGVGGAVGAAAAGRGGAVERVGVLGMNLNYQGFLYAAALTGILCHGLARWPRFGTWEWILAGGGASVLLALLRTGSRGALVVLVAGVAAALALMFRGRRWGAYALMVPVVLYGIGSAIMRSEVIRARVEATLYEGDYGTRDALAREAWEMFKERPLTGWGTNYIEELGARMGKLRIAAHNTYLQVVSAFGLVGLVPWLWGLAATGFRLWRYRTNPRAATLLAIFIALLVAMIPGNYAYGRFKWIFLALAGAMPLAPPPPAGHARTEATTDASGARLRARGRPARWGIGVGMAR